MGTTTIIFPVATSTVHLVNDTNSPNNTAHTEMSSSESVMKTTSLNAGHTDQPPSITPTQGTPDYTTNAQPHPNTVSPHTNTTLPMSPQTVNTESRAGPMSNHTTVQSVSSDSESTTHASKTASPVVTTEEVKLNLSMVTSDSSNTSTTADYSTTQHRVTTTPSVVSSTSDVTHTPDFKQTAEATVLFEKSPTSSNEVPVTSDNLDFTRVSSHEGITEQSRASPDGAHSSDIYHSTATPVTIPATKQSKTMTFDTNTATPEVVPSSQHQTEVPTGGNNKRYTVGMVTDISVVTEEGQRSSTPALDPTTGDNFSTKATVPITTKSHTVSYPSETNVNDTSDHPVSYTTDNTSLHLTTSNIHKPLTTTNSTTISPSIVPNITISGVTSPSIVPNSTISSVTSPSIVPNSTISSVTSPSIVPNSTVSEVMSPSIVPNSTTSGVASPSIVVNSTVSGMTSPSIVPNSTISGVTSPSIVPNSTVPGVTSPSIVPNSTVSGVTSSSIAPNSTTSISGVTSPSIVPDSTVSGVTSPTTVHNYNVTSPTSSNTSRTNTDGKENTTDWNPTSSIYQISSETHPTMSSPTTLPVTPTTDIERSTHGGDDHTSQGPTSTQTETPPPCRDVGVNDVSCLAYIEKHGVHMCYTIDRLCCETCARIKAFGQVDCPYGDREARCVDLPRSRCYHRNDTCCESCAEFKRGAVGNVLA